MTDVTNAQGPAPSTDTAFFGHPRGLAILFLTEMWERFSYYGMRALLIFYLTQHFLISDERSALIYGAYVALVYVMTVIGGTLADRYLGQRKAVAFGAILLVFGHFGMAFEGSGSKQFINYQGTEYQLTLDGRGGDAKSVIKSETGSSRVTFEGGVMQVEKPKAVGLPALVDASDYTTRKTHEPLFRNILFLSLALIITGVGFLKANISTIVGALYGFGDRRRDSGFTIFYMGINLGAAVSAIACGTLGELYGWKYGFGLAGIGMLIGLVIFLSFQHWLEGKADPPDPEKLKKRVFLFINVEWLCYLTGLALIGVAMLLVMNEEVVGGLLGPFGLIMFAFLVGYAIVKCDKIERDRMFVAIYVVIAQIPFWALFEQAGSSLNLFTGRLVDRTILGLTIPTTWFQSVNAIFIFIFAPMMAWLWIKLAKVNRNPSTPVKFSFGVFMVGLGFLALVAGMKTTDATAMTPMVFILLIYWIHTIGELTLSPVGLSAVTKLAPARVVGMTMGAWFLFTGLSNYLSGIIASATGAETIGGQLTDVAAAKATYASVYTEVGWYAMGIAFVMLLVSPVLKRMMHGEQ